jgi:hypothetical protein
VNEDTRTRIDATIEAVASADPSAEYETAERVLRTQQSDVLFALATAALVDAARRRRRGAVLTVEREAEGRRRQTGAERAAVAERNDSERVAFLAPALARILDDYAAALRVDWTAELLASEFAMPDGTRTTWGEATITQHRERVAMFTVNAQANIEGAARHQRAIDELTTSGAATLGDLLTAVPS